MGDSDVVSINRLRKYLFGMLKYSMNKSKKLYEVKTEIDWQRKYCEKEHI